MANQYDTNLKLQAIADAIGDTQSSGLISALEDIADAVAGGGGGGSSTAGLVSDNFSETDTYDLGDFCIHNNTLYVCINAINTPGPWDLSDWQATNAGIQLSSLNSALTDVEEIVTANELGTYVNISSYTSDWYICPSDGYIHIRCNTAGTTMQAQITGPTGGVDLYLKAIGASGGVFDSISVKKGMKVKMIKTGSGDAYGYFVPLE